MHKISECLQQSVVQIFILRMDFVNVSIFLALFIDWSMFTNVVLYYKYVKDEISQLKKILCPVRELNVPHL